MSNKFCRYLTNGLRVQSWAGQVAASPCCYIPQKSINDPDYQQQQNQYYQLDYCGQCLHQVGGDRESLSYSPNQSRQRVADVDHTDPVYIEFSLDNRCNAACLSCNDSFSTLWQKQNIKFSIKTQADYSDPQADLAVVDRVFEQWSFEHAAVVNFFGGEPMVSDTTELVLKRLVGLGRAHCIHLIITTNGSCAPSPELTELIRQFKQVTMIYSIDSIDEQFYYLRWPLKWSRMQSTVNTVLSLDLPGLDIVVSMTVNALNIFYIRELEAWCRTRFAGEHRFTGFGTSPCAGELSTDALPVSAREYLTQELSLDHPRVVRMIQGTYQPGATTQLIEFLDKWDQRRQTNWRETWPRAVAFLNEQ